MRTPIVAADLKRILSADLDFSSFKKKTFLISGAYGFIPGFVIETLVELNRQMNLEIKIIALARNEKKLHSRFAHCIEEIEPLIQDVCAPCPEAAKADFIIHAASPASPKYYLENPVGTILPNTLGTVQLLQAAHSRCQFLFVSSSEVYGLPPDSQPLDERRFFGLDPFTIRSCYAEGKRAGEALSLSWMQQFNLTTKVIRPFHTYGPTMDLDDGRVFCDFVRDVVRENKISLKSSGEAIRAYCYISDAIEGFFRVLLDGRSGEAFNLGAPQNAVSVKKLAQIIQSLFGAEKIQLNFSERNPKDSYLPSAAQALVPDITKLRNLGWQPQISLEDGFRRTIEHFKIVEKI